MHLILAALHTEWYAAQSRCLAKNAGPHICRSSSLMLHDCRHICLAVMTDNICGSLAVVREVKGGWRLHHDWLVHHHGLVVHGLRRVEGGFRVVLSLGDWTAHWEVGVHLVGGGDLRFIGVLEGLADDWIVGGLFIHVHVGISDGPSLDNVI